MTQRSRFKRGALALAVFMLPAFAGADAGGYEVLRDRIYIERSSGPLKGDLYLSAVDRPVPAVVMIHGGGWRDGDLGDMEKLARRVAGAGFAVFNVTYRLAPGHRFPAQLEDVRSAVRWLRANAARHNIDPERIGAWGYSAGAHLAMLLGTVDDDALADAAFPAPSARVSAVVAGAGPTDLREYPDNHYVADLMPDTAGDRLFELASPVAMASANDAPMFLYHGRHDMIVAYSNSENMYRALRNAGVEAHLYQMAFGHVVNFLFAGAAVDAGIDFLNTHLK